MSKTIVIFSTKGGVGKTLIASNLAVTLARDEEKKVCLVDLNLQGAGDMARMLDIVPKRAMVDLMETLKRHKPQEIRKEDYIVKSNIGIDFIPAVLKPQHSSYLDPERIKDVFSIIDKDYDYTVVDAGKVFRETLFSRYGFWRLRCRQRKRSCCGLYRRSKEY